MLPTLLTAEGADGVGDDSAGGNRAAAGGSAQQEGCWASGMCALFPGTTSVTMGYAKDAHLLALADKCHELTYADFNGCGGLGMGIGFTRLNAMLYAAKNPSVKDKGSSVNP